MIIGGLHHCVVDIRQSIKNIATLVRPGGVVLMMEPNRRYFLEGIRRLWYRLDKSFDAATEAALDHAELAAIGAPWFRVRRVTHLGGPAFFLIQNSMITRVPLRAKPALSKVLFPLERLCARIPGTRLHAYFVAVWERLDRATSEDDR
jgi:SAM-dependent methyltransferase